MFEGDDLTNPRAAAPEASADGPVRYLAIADPGAQREIYLTWPAERPLLPAAELFRAHVVSRVTVGKVPALPLALL